jgi:hypothetical protein
MDSLSDGEMDMDLLDFASTKPKKESSKLVQVGRNGKKKEKGKLNSYLNCRKESGK